MPSKFVRMPRTMLPSEHPNWLKSAKHRVQVVASRARAAKRRRVAGPISPPKPLIWPNEDYADLSFTRKG